RAVDLNTLGIHCRAHHRHVVLPADHRTEPADVGVVDRERRAVAEAPHQPFGAGRHQLAVLAEISTVRREEQHRTIERAAITLDYPNHQVRAILLSDAAKHVNRRTWYIY